ncbi:MAG: gliding motility-associated C-terminal domain-containing protein [Saprospiraceae bacterium]
MKKYIAITCALISFIQISFSQTWTVSPAGCPGGAVINKIIIDACTMDEGWNEFVTMTNGSSAINVNSIQMTGSTNGPPTSTVFGTNPAITTYLNNLASPACVPPVFVDPPGGIVPANAKIIAFVSSHGPTFTKNLNNICNQGPIYVVSGNYPLSTGFFLNAPNASCPGAPAPCPKVITIIVGGCTYNVTYNVRGFPVNDGSNVTLAAGGVTNSIDANGDCFPILPCSTPPPQTVALSNSVLCAGVANTVNPSLSTPQISGATYQWSGPSGYSSSSYNPSSQNFTLSAGTYTFSVTVSNGPACSVTASKDITVNPTPNYTAIPDITVCGTTAVPLAVLGTPGPPVGSTYQWSGPGLSSTAIATPTATAPIPTFPTAFQTSAYAVTVTDPSGCKWTDAFNIVVYPAPATFAVVNPVNVCVGQQINLTVTGATITVPIFGTIPLPSPFPIFGKFTWTGPNGFNSVTTNNVAPYVVAVPSGQAPAAPGSYLYTLKVGVANFADNSCQSTPVNVTVNMIAGQQTTFNNATVCSGNSINLNTLISGPIPIPTGSWSGPGVSASPTFNGSLLSAGSYSVTFTPTPSTCYIGGTTNVTVTAPNVATTSQTGTLCGTSAPYSGSVTLSASSGFFYYKWSNGTMGNSNNSIAVTNPGNYTLTITDLVGCTEVKSFNVVTGSITNVAIAAPTSICTGFNATLSLNNPYANYLWNDGSSNPTLAINSPGTYSVTVTDPSGCTSTDTKTISPGSTLSPSIAPFGKICGSGTVSLSVTTSFSSYLWSNNSTTQSISVSSGGSYSVTVGNVATGCKGTTTVNVDQFIAPAVSIAGNNNFCPGSGTALVTNPANFSNYQWSNNQNSPGIFATQSGTFTVTVTDSNGCTATASQLVSSFPTPTPQINGNSLVCTGASANLNVSGGIFSNYLWSNTQTSNTIQVGNGTYTVTVTDLNGCKASQTKIINVDLVNINFVGNLNVCPGKTTSIAVQNIFNNYSWSTGNNNSSISVGAGTYAITVTNSNGCTGISAVTINPYNQPQVSIDGSSSYCQGTSLSLTTTPSFSTYTWSNGSTTASIIASGTGTYQITVSDINGCTASAARNIIENPNPKPSITGSTSICSGSSSILDAGQVFSSYVWSTGETSKNISISQIGTVSLTVTDTNGCKGSDSKTITSNGTLQFNISGNPAFCEGKSTVLDAGVGFITYIWDTGETTQTIQASVEKNYQVTVSNGNCSGSATINVLKNLPTPFNIQGDTAICTGFNTVLKTSVGFSAYKWSNNDLNASISVGSAGIYSVTVTDNNGCLAVQSISITVNANPLPIITGATSICALDSIKLALSAPFVSYLWSNGKTDDSIFGKANMQYAVTVTDNNGCKGSSSANIPLQNNLNPKIDGTLSICSGKTTTLSIQNLFDNYIWSTNETKNSIQVNTPGVYAVTVTNNSGCSGTTSVTVQQSNLPAPVIKGSDVICGNNSNSLNAGNGYFSYNWSDGSTAQIISVTQAGTYQVTVSNQNGCTSSTDIKVVKVNTNGLLTDTLCKDDFRIVNGKRYDFNNPSGVEILANAAFRSCDSTLNVKFYFRSALAVSFQGASSICTKSSVSLILNVSGYTGQFDLVYKDNFGNNYSVSNVKNGDSIIVNPVSTTTYTIISTTIPNGICTSTLGSHTIDYGTLLLNAVVGNITCSALVDGAVQLTPTGVAPFTYNWSNGNTTAFNNNLAAGKFQVTVTDAIGCTATSEFEIFSPLPLKAEVVPQAASCISGLGTIFIKSIEGGSGKFTYEIDGVNKGDIPGIPYQIKNLSPGEHELYIREAANKDCNWSIKTKIQNSDSIQVTLGPDITINYGDSVVITPTTKFQMSKIRWTPKTGLDCDTCQFPIAKPKVTKNYKVTVWDEEGCTASDVIQIVVNKVRRVYIPNTFSPNVDGNNDYIKIYLGDETVKVNYFRIFDRWGTLIYEDGNFSRAESQDEKRGWNGYYRGNLMNPGIFIYHAQVEFTDGEVKNYSGDFMLMKW